MFKRFWWVLPVMGFIGPVFGLLVAAVVTYIMPKQYESVAKIEVRRSDASSEIVATELEKIKSRDSLVRVIDELDLTDRWGSDREEAIRRLQAIIDAQSIRGTDLISIRARHPNKEDARDLAAEVAIAYQQYRNGIAVQEDERRIEGLRKAVREQDDQVEKRRKALSTIVRTKGILYGEDSLSAQAADVPEELAAQFELDARDYIDAKRELEADEALLQHIRIKLIGESIESSSPRDHVIIHDHPVIPTIPVSPNVQLNLVLGAGFGFLLSPLLALALMAFLNRSNPGGRRETVN